MPEQATAPKTAEPINPIDVILKKAGLKKLTDVPLAMFFVWGRASEEMPNRLWEVEQPVPLEITRGKDKISFSMLTIAFMFQSETEVRVYAVDRATDSSTAPHRFTLPKNFISPFIEMFPNPSVFIDEVAAEFEALALGESEDTNMEDALEDDSEDDEEGDTR